MNIIGHIICGIGLIFLGIKLLTTYLKNVSTFALKEKMAKLTKNTVLGILLGGVFAVLTQSTSAGVLMLICTLKAGMTKLRNCFPVIVGINIFCAATVFALAFDIKVFIYFSLGVAALIFTSNIFHKYKNIAGVFIGVGILFLGLYMIQESVLGAQNLLWFKNSLLLVHKSYLFGFVVGAFLSIISQSALIILLIVMVLYKSSIIDLHSSMMLVYGAFFGSSFLMWILSFNIFGEAKQLAIFQVLHNVVGSIILVTLLYAEVYCKIPNIGAFVSLFDNRGVQVATFGLIFDLIAGIIMLALISILSNKLAKAYPETIEENISKPHYLFSDVAATMDVTNVIALIELEQARLIEANSHIFMLLRNGKSQNNIEQFSDAVTDLAKLIRDYLTDLPKKYSIESGAYYRLGLLFDIQNSVEMLIPAIKNLSLLLVEKSFFTGKGKSDFYNTIVEGIDALLITTSMVLHDHNDPFAEHITKMTLKSEEKINKIREALTRSLTDESTASKFKLVSIICDSERVVVLLNKIATEISVLKNEQAAG